MSSDVWWATGQFSLGLCSVGSSTQFKEDNSVQSRLVGTPVPFTAIQRVRTVQLTLNYALMSGLSKIPKRYNERAGPPSSDGPVLNAMYFVGIDASLGGNS